MAVSLGKVCKLKINILILIIIKSFCYFLWFEFMVSILLNEWLGRKVVESILSR